MRVTGGERGRGGRAGLLLGGVALMVVIGAAVVALWLGRATPPGGHETSDAPRDRSVAPTVAPSAPVASRAAPQREVDDRTSPPAAASGRAGARDDAQASVPEAGAAPLPDLLDAEGEPTRALVHAALADAVERHLPDRKLSSEELRAASDALWRLREARLQLQALGDDPAHARRRAELVEQIGEATSDFSYQLDMTPSELTALDESDGGLSAPPPESWRSRP